MKAKGFCLFLTAALLLSGCAAPPQSQSSDLPVRTVSTPEDSAQYFSDRDLDPSYEEDSAARITLNGTTARCDSDAVEISGSTVTILDEGTYILSGTLDDGMVVVNAEESDKVQLVLDNVTIHSGSYAPLFVLQADKVFLTLAQNSVNTLSNAGSFTPLEDTNLDAVIFSKDDLTINGTGSLTVTSPAGHGILSKDELTITGGTFTVDAASHALCAKDSVCIAQGVFTLTAGKDGIHSENDEDADDGAVRIQNGTFTIRALGDGISAGSRLQIDRGSFDIITGGGSANAPQRQTSGGFPAQRGRGESFEGQTPPAGQSYADVQTQTDTQEDTVSTKGLKSGGAMTLVAGEYTIDAADDAIHANAPLTVHAGTFTLASGDDAFHSDDALTIADGTISISQSYEGLEGLTVDILGGSITLYAEDDGINAAGGADQSGFGGAQGGDKFSADSENYIHISGGSLFLGADGDGLDSNGDLFLSGGDVVVSGPDQGDTSILDYSGTGTVTGGTFIGTGMAGMNSGFHISSTQGAIMLSTQSQSAGTLVTLTDDEGNVLVSHETQQNFSCVILSHPALKQGESYTLTVGESETQITLDSLVYSSGSSLAGGGMSGFGPGGAAPEGGMPPEKNPGMMPGEMPGVGTPNGGFSPRKGSMPQPPAS